MGVLHDLDDARGWLRYLAALSVDPQERARWAALSEHWHDLAPELRAGLADAWFQAELSPRFKGRAPVRYPDGG